jgi:glyoxylase-like metal-dependent hydrolase (beta-lactamase superfamily II)
VVKTIDLHHLGRERVIAAYLLDDVIVDPGPSSCLDALLAGLDGVTPRALLLTHIHLDHAGASGTLAARFPGLEVYVHERGARHLASPGRLLDSATRLYGADMDRLWGEFLPVPEDRLRVLRGGERVIGDRFEVAYTPGHASHHVSYRHAGTAFVGDVGGVRITGTTLTIPPTPPPDIDLELWHESLGIVRAWAPEQLAMTHFGVSHDVEAQLAEVDRRLGEWSRYAEHHDAGEFIAMVKAEVEADAGPEIAAAYVQAAPPDQLYAGYERYWRKRSERGESTPSARVS